MTLSPHDRLVLSRLCNQRLQLTDFRRPEEVVSWLGAVQAQDFAGAKWALGLRARGISNADVDRAFDTGALLRTHVLRPTWHLVAPADIRWMLALTAPRVNAINAYYYRQHGLDGRTFLRSQTVFERALRGGRQLMRTELAAELKRAGIAVSGARLALIVMRAELDALICSGARDGRQFTYALLEERAPPAMSLTRDEALEALTRRYFASHGPATVRDYAWWSGLTVPDARIGLDLATGRLVHERVGGEIYWWFEPATAMPRRKAAAHLLPNYDEYLIAYKDREPVVGPRAARRPAAGEFANQLVIDGRLAGSWKRTAGTSLASVDVKPSRFLTPAQEQALHASVERYRRFVGVP